MTRERWSDFSSEEREVLEVLGMRAVSGEQSSLCPPAELLSALREDVLPQELRARVESHVASCALCRSLQNDVTERPAPRLSPQIEARIRSRLPISRDGARERNGPGFWTSWWRPAVALGAVAAVLIIVLLRSSKPAGDSVAHTVSTPAPKPAEHLIALDKPAVKLTASALVFRGADSQGNQFTRDLAPALDDYRHDKYSDAARSFARLAVKYPKSVEVYFYLGVSRLFINDNAGAVEALGTAQKLADDSFHNDVAWYLMLAHQRAGDREQAEQERQQICAAHGPYSERACAAPVR